MLTHRPFRAVAVLVSAVLMLTGCSLIPDEKPAPQPTAQADPTVAPMPFNSEFSRDGTFQSHILIDGIDFVYTFWAAKTTPRMAEWHPKGDKYFSMSFQGYDTRRRLRDPFRTKRLVWLERVQVTSQTSTSSSTTESPYNLDEWAPDITFDPQARTRGRMGMLITSPKGAFELRNQVIKDMADDTEGITLNLRAVVHIQARAGAKRYVKREVTLQLPIAIFESKYATSPQPVPYNAS